MSITETLSDLLRGRRVAVLSGAGCSTESGIPDYGGLNSKTRGTRIQYREFVNDPFARARYWARSTIGWSRVADAKPNAAHHAIATLEQAGVVSGVITQNVDGLHQRAGSERVVELHGTLSRVRCLVCGNVQSRAALQAQLLDLNPFLRDWTAIAAPDGDAEVEDDQITSVVVPGCERCSGVLKPDVVFFGENVPGDRVESAWALYGAADVLLVVGTSLAVYSGYRFVVRAVKDGRPVVIVNDAETRGDDDAALCVRGQVGTVLSSLAARLVDEAVPAAE